MNRLIRTTLLSTALAASASFAFAQGQHDAQRPFSRPTERVEARLAYVRTALKITDAQQAQWNAYAAAVRQEAAEREKKMQAWHEKRAQGRKESPSAVERLDRAEKMHAQAIARLDSRIAVVKPLYASLNAEQKKVADVVLVPQRHRHGGFGDGHGRPRARA